MVKTNPELYYIVAKSLLINDRYHRAIRTIKKALYFAPNNADYLIVLGDAYSAQAKAAKRNDEDPYNANRLFSKAKDTYDKAMAIMKKNGNEFRTNLKEKIKAISEKMK